MNFYFNNAVVLYKYWTYTRHNKRQFTQCYQKNLPSDKEYIRLTVGGDVVTLSFYILHRFRDITTMSEQRHIVSFLHEENGVENLPSSQHRFPRVEMRLYGAQLADVLISQCEETALSWSRCRVEALTPNEPQQLCADCSRFIWASAVPVSIALVALQ